MPFSSPAPLWWLLADFHCLTSRRCWISSKTWWWLMPGSWSKLDTKSPSGVTHWVGATGLKPKSRSVAMVAVTGPLTVIHLFLEAATFRYALTHTLLMLFLVLLAALDQMLTHALICCMGMETLGSAWADLALLLLKAQARMEVLQALAPAMPVASVVLALHLSMHEGDMPTAVWPYSCAGLIAVIASFLAFLFLLARKLARFALLEQALTRSSCFVTVLAAAEEVSTPMSTPSFIIFIGMLAATARLENTSAALHTGTTALLSEMSSLRSSPIFEVLCPLESLVAEFLLGSAPGEVRDVVDVEV